MTVRVKGDLAVMDKARILVVDDEAGIRQLVKTFLSRYHYEILEAETGQGCLKLMATETVDLVILDLMLPDMYGLDVCKKIREHSTVPIIMLTAVQGEMNTVLGFEAGADDYVEKPFSAQVLLSRIQAILKRAGQGGKAMPLSEVAVPEAKPVTSEVVTMVAFDRATFGNWTYHRQDAYLEHSSGKQIFLTRNECTLLELFLLHQESILSRDKIASKLQVDIDDPESRAIDVQISRLRNKLKDRSQHNFIQSIRNKGYLFAVPVRLYK